MFSILSLKKSLSKLCLILMSTLLLSSGLGSIALATQTPTVRHVADMVFMSSENGILAPLYVTLASDMVINYTKKSTSDDVINYVFANGTIPKSPFSFNSDFSSIAVYYADMAYSGYALSSTSSFYVPSSTISGSNYYTSSGTWYCYQPVYLANNIFVNVYIMGVDSGNGWTIYNKVSGGI